MSENSNAEVLPTEIVLDTPPTDVDNTQTEDNIGEILEDNLQPKDKDDIKNNIKIMEIKDTTAPVEDDGIAGIPIFTETDYELMENILVLDTSVIKQNTDLIRLIGQTLKDTVELSCSLKDIRKYISTVVDNRDEGVDAYIAARNILVEYRNAITEYNQFIQSNKDEILNKYSVVSDSIVKDYIERSSKEFDIEYKEGSLMFFIQAVALKRAAREVLAGNNSVISILKMKYLSEDYDFENVIYDALKPVITMVSNISNSKSTSSMSTIERDTMRIVSDTVKRLRKISTFNETDEVFQKLPTPKNIVLSFLFRLSNIVNRKIKTKFKTESCKYTNDNRRFKSKQKGKDKKNLPFHDAFVKTRFALLMVESSIKKFFSISLFGDRSVLNSKVEFLSIIQDIDSKFSKAETLSALVNTLFFEHIFNEFVEIIKLVPEGSEFKSNVTKMNIIKSYVMTIDYYSKSTCYHDYDFKELYSDYLEIIAYMLNKHFRKDDKIEIINTESVTTTD